MKRKLLAALGAVLLLALASARPAGAGTLTSLTLSIDVGTLQPVSFTATGLAAGAASGTGTTATWQVAAGAIPSGFTTTTVPSSAAPPVTQIQLVLAGNPSPGAFAASAPGSMRISGVVNPKFGGGLTLFPIPLAIGVPTTTQITSYGIGVTAIANAWTTKTTTLALTISTTAGPSQVTAMGANGLVGGAGTVVLVSAINVLTNIAGQLPTFATLTLNYAPEPGALALLGTGIAALALAGRRTRGSGRTRREEDRS